MVVTRRRAAFISSLVESNVDEYIESRFPLDCLPQPLLKRPDTHFLPERISAGGRTRPPHHATEGARLGEEGVQQEGCRRTELGWDGHWEGRELNVEKKCWEGQLVPACPLPRRERPLVSCMNKGTWHRQHQRHTAARSFPYFILMFLRACHERQYRGVRHAVRERERESPSTHVTVSFHLRMATNTTHAAFGREVSLSSTLKA